MSSDVNSDSDTSISVPSNLELPSSEVSDEVSDESVDHEKSGESVESKVSEESNESDESVDHEKSGESVESKVSEESNESDESVKSGDSDQSDGSSASEECDEQEEGGERIEEEPDWFDDLEGEDTSDQNGDKLSHQISGKRKRKAFKKGFLRKSKQGRRKSQKASQPESEDQSEDYLDIVGLVLSEDPSAECDASTCSISESCPSEGEKNKEPQPNKEAESSAVDTHPQEAQRKVKRRKAIGRKSKYSWKKTNVSCAQDSSEQEEKREVGTSVDPKDIDKSFLESTHFTYDNLPTLANYLQLLLDEKWIVSHSDDTLYLTKLTNPSNPVVERSITWAQGRVTFWVLNRQLHSGHDLWRMKKPDAGNAKSVADYLATVSNRFLYFEVCSGVVSHQTHWTKFSASGHGKIVSHLEPPCLRSSNCNSLIVYPTKCTSCRKLQRKIMDYERQKARTTERINVDQSRRNNKYLQSDELGDKIKRIQKEKKLSKQTIKRMEKRIDQLIQKNAESVSSELSDDFVEIMNSNSAKMTAVEKLFWAQQSLALSKRGKSRTMRWHPAMIRLALHLRMISPAAFDFMGGILSLPSSRRLFDYSQFTEIQEGVQEDLLEELKKLIGQTCPHDYHKYFSLLLDEMSIRSDLVYSSRTGELIGFTNLTSLEAELASLEAEIAGKTDEKRLAKKVLVLMLHGCVNPILFVAAVYSTDDLSASQLYTRTWEVIYAVEEAGAKVLVVIFDGASVNRKFIRMHFNMGDRDFVHVTMNFASGERRLIYFMLDPPHLLKTFRNCLANSFSHRKSRELCNNDEKLSWKAIEALFELSRNEKFKKLTKAHVYLTSFSCMNVLLAAQVFSNKVVKGLRERKDVSPLKEEYSEELVKFIDLMNRWFDCLNGGESSEKKKDNPDLCEYTSVNDPRLQFLEGEFMQYLEDWEKFVREREGNFTKEQRGKMLISYQSLEGMKITIHSFVAVCKFLLGKGAPSVSSRKYNQDPLEQYFSDLRRAGGADNNPSLKQVLHTRLSLLAQGQCFSRSKHGNTEVRKRQLEVDDSPLNVRAKKPKK